MDSSFLIQVCRFDESGKLQRQNIDISCNSYIAVSHVWADATWRSDIGCVDWEIIASPQKTQWINKQLPKLVKGSFFWMDVLCVDQRSDEARIGIVAMIPDIYYRAEKTIVVREPFGVQSCCATAIGHFETWHGDGQERFAEHLRDFHVDGIKESWFERLWPLQELILSDCVLFTTCEYPEAMKPPPPAGVDYFDAHITFRRVSDSMYCTAQAWLQYAMESSIDEKEFTMFIRAFLNNRLVRRRHREVKSQTMRDLRNDFSIHLTASASQVSHETSSWLSCPSTAGMSYLKI